ncbi:hypothetical protein [Criblamydia sequanensis]|uniref:Uncharacterized protein n=1 Tax=Candidatus Criblamydia sequanensis CRIB-18 TaxID=1437425 RepID=A0A090D1U0_9BACT|nr:hypothetical protein [Criblamydia sequanensis]CDR33743.1 Hypothetical protein CSEC_0916 [Criblamydia sequanensis CRIB-18]
MLLGKANNIDVISEGGIVLVISLKAGCLTLLKMSLKKQPYQFEISELNMMYEGNQITIDNQGALRVKNSLGGSMNFYDSYFTAKPFSNTFCLKIHSEGKIEGFGVN